MLEFLGVRITNALRKINQNFLYEIRIRAGQPITVNYKGEYIYFGDDGVTNFVKDAIICTKKEVEDIVYSAGKFSVYAVEDQIRKGFISAENGVRVG